MKEKKNFLLGKGEKLTEVVNVPSGGGDKQAPYDFQTAKKRLSSKLESVSQKLDTIPKEACPNNEVVALVTMHPRYTSKSDFPETLLSSIGLRAVGGKSTKIEPEKWGIKKPPKEATTEQIFVAGKIENFKKWSTTISDWNENTGSNITITKIEDITYFESSQKLFSIPDKEVETFFEVVLHNDNHDSILEQFSNYCKKLNVGVIRERVREVGGLTFVPIKCSPSQIESIALFTFVRVARGMPTIRPVQPSILRGGPSSSIEIPNSNVNENGIKVAVFDGGLPEKHHFSNWVTRFDPPGIGPADPTYLQHGYWVTSALLFGHIHSSTLADPLVKVDHYRVLDTNTGKGINGLECLDVLDRIVSVLSDNDKRYEFINLSLGPNMASTDHEVTLWTATLDQKLANYEALVTVAAGNDGERDAIVGLNRIQPPADGVNILSVGASDSHANANWKRASYSCIGPGRKPGFVKPDGLAFGGAEDETFNVVDASSTPKLTGVTGTSFAAPLVLRAASGVKSMIGADINPRTIRALLIHKAKSNKKHKKSDVGWGKFETEVDEIISCSDDEFLVIYQGELPVGEHLRANVPLPKMPLLGKVTLTATLVITPEVDPEFPGAYTRSGLEVSFRPNSTKFKFYNSKKAKHPETKSFFSTGKLYGKDEASLRKDSHKWEPCLKGSANFVGSKLKNPCFDIYYHHRASATAQTDPKPIPYSLVISLKAPKVKNLYDQVVRDYANILLQLKPQIDIKVRTKGS